MLTKDANHGKIFDITANFKFSNTTENDMNTLNGFHGKHADFLLLYCQNLNMLIKGYILQVF